MSWPETSALPRIRFSVCALLRPANQVSAGVAQVGDWAVGTGSKKHKRDKNIVYAMRVTEAMTFDQYWTCPRFQRRKPNLRGSKKQAFGDNIYSKDARTNLWCQLNSHHSLSDGSPNESNVVADTKRRPNSHQRRFCLLGRFRPASAADISELWNSRHKPLCRTWLQE